jgi:hypothetical protein
MSCLLDLPSELRQAILLLALPTHITVGESMPSPIAGILLICKSLKKDTLEIIKQHRPIYIVRYPVHLQYLQHVEHVTHIKLELFSTSTIHNLRNHFFTPWETPPLEALFSQWSVELVHLAKSVPKTVIVDLSPVPGYGREKSQEWISFLVNDSKISKRLFNKKDHQIASLVATIGSILGDSNKAKEKPGVTLIVGGFMSRKSGERIPRVLEVLESLKRQGVRTDFQPEYLDEENVSTFEQADNPLDAALLDLEPELQKAWEGVRARVSRAFRRDRGLRQIFIKNEMKNAEWTTCSIQQLALLAIDQLSERETKLELDHKVNSIMFENVEPLERAWLHQIAGVLNLHTLSSDGRGNGRVVLKSVKVWN